MLIFAFLKNLASKFSGIKITEKKIKIHYTLSDKPEKGHTFKKLIILEVKSCKKLVRILQDFKFFQICIDKLTDQREHEQHPLLISLHFSQTNRQFVEQDLSSLNFHKKLKFLIVIFFF